MAMCMWKSERSVKKNAEVYRIMLKQETRAHIRKVSDILRKPIESLTEDEHLLLAQSEEVIERIKKRTHLKELTKLRHQEIEDGASELQDKCRRLANAIRNARHLVVYTGAGISTAASIPDYRGPNGVWTMLRQGKLVRTKDLSEAEPTYTHMSIAELYRSGYINQVVSQNCDGLHLRSGLSTSALSELHGNMYIELCKQCRPQRQYVRLCDVTERTAMRKHKTGRRCHRCRAELYDTIVHFGEKGGFQAPYNWKRATHAADCADVILCLGSSLKVLKRYPCLWGMHKPPSQRPRLYIVNLQWTPKDHNATLKINGKCDDVLRLVMDSLALDVPQYTRELDPIFAIATDFRKNELKMVSKKVLVKPPAYDHDKVNQRMKQLVRCAKSRPKSPALKISSAFSDVIYEDVVEDECMEDISCLLNEETDLDVEIKVENDDEKKTPAESSESEFISEHGIQTITCDTTPKDLLDQISLPLIGSPHCQFPINAAHPVGIPPWYTTSIVPSPSALNRTLVVPGLGTNDFWWNSIDSQTWLMGLQNYLFLHSFSGLGHSMIGPAPNLIASRVEGIPTPGQQYWAPPNYCSQPPVLNFNGSNPRLHFMPMASGAPLKNANCPRSDRVQFECPPRRIKPDSVSKSHSAVDLVKFMHNYCIPPSRTDVSSSQVRCDGKDRDGLSSDILRIQTRDCVARQSKRATDDLERCEVTSVTASLCQVDHSESDTDSAVVFTTGGSSAMSTPSPSSTVTENWFDESSWSPSLPTIDNLNVAGSSLERRKIDVTSGRTSESSPDVELTTPGWFGKGVGLRRQRKRRYRRDSR